MTLKRVRQIKPALDSHRIPYAIVSVDKLIEIAERIVLLEQQVKKLSAVDHEGDTIELLVPHISDFRDGKIFVRAQAEDGTIYRAEIQTIGAIEKDPEYGN
jgi:hypothetical protein